MDIDKNDKIGSHRDNIDYRQGNYRTRIDKGNYGESIEGNYIENKIRIKLNLLRNKNIIIIIIFIFSLSFPLYVLGDFLAKRKSLVSPKDNVTIFIVDENGQPINQAKISFIEDDFLNHELTDSTGYARIKNIKFSHNTIDILIKKEGFEPIIEEINLDNKSVTNKIFKLEKVVDKQ